MALRLLDGAAPETMGAKYAAESGCDFVDWRALRRWRVPLSRLPAGTVVLHRPQPIWRSYRRELTALLATLLSLSVLVLILLGQRRHLLKTRGLLREEHQELKRSQAELRRLAEMLLQADEDEKGRLARELHDDVSQRLAALALGMEQLDKALGGDLKEARAAIADQRRALVALGRDLHDLSRQLHPAILDDLGLVRALQSACDSLARQACIRIHFYHDNVPEKLPAKVALCIYRVAQEALANTVKHARADEVRVFLAGRAEGLELVVEDEGVGFDTEAERAGSGIGLAVMQERVRLAHGSVSIFSQLGEGTSIRVLVPLESEGHDEGASAAG
jgi:signal transduction histidine kinase